MKSYQNNIYISPDQFLSFVWFQVFELTIWSLLNLMVLIQVKHVPFVKSENSRRQNIFEIMTKRLILQIIVFKIPFNPTINKNFSCHQIINSIRNVLLLVFLRPIADQLVASCNTKHKTTNEVPYLIQAWVQRWSRRRRWRRGIYRAV